MLETPRDREHHWRMPSRSAFIICDNNGTMRIMKIIKVSNVRFSSNIYFFDRFTNSIREIYIHIELRLLFEANPLMLCSSFITVFLLCVLASVCCMHACMSGFVWVFFSGNNNNEYLKSYPLRANIDRPTGPMEMRIRMRQRERNQCYTFDI